MTQVSAVLLITRDSGADVLFATEDLPDGCIWHGMPKDNGYWTFRGDMFGSTHALVGDYSPTTADDLVGFGMAIPDGLLGMMEEPWIHGDILPTKVSDDWLADDRSDKFLVAFLYQSPDQLDAAMCIARYDFGGQRWETLRPTDIVVAWKALPDFPIGML